MRGDIEDERERVRRDGETVRVGEKRGREKSVRRQTENEKREWEEGESRMRKKGGDIEDERQREEWENGGSDRVRADKRKSGRRG